MYSSAAKERYILYMHIMTWLCYDCVLIDYLR